MQTLSSKDVAEMLGKRHDNLLRSIRKYCVALGEDADKYFILDNTGRNTAYKVTEAGCKLLGGRIIGKAGDEFKSWYRGALGESVSDMENEGIITDVPQVKEYSVAEVAEKLGVSERSIYRNIQIGKLEAVEREVMIPTLKKFVTEEALEKYKAERMVS